MTPSHTSLTRFHTDRFHSGLCAWSEGSDSASAPLTPFHTSMTRFHTDQGSFRLSAPSAIAGQTLGSLDPIPHFNDPKPHFKRSLRTNRTSEPSQRRLSTGTARRSVPILRGSSCHFPCSCSLMPVMHQPRAEQGRTFAAENTVTPFRTSMTRFRTWRTPFHTAVTPFHT